MNTAAVAQIAKAVLYEGYMLYPYRPSAVKNQQRFNFGVVYPQAFSEAQKGTEPYTMTTECLVEGTPQSRLEVRVRFLQLVDRSVEQCAGDGFRPVKSLIVGDRTFYSWQEAIEREVPIPSAELSQLSASGVRQEIQFAGDMSEEALLDQRNARVGRIMRWQRSINGTIDVTAQSLALNVFKIIVRVRNLTAANNEDLRRDEALLRSFVSAHAVLGVENGAFVSLLEPPEHLKSCASDCRNQGVFPVLVGEAGQRDTLLASPIILYDYPQIAPESNGDLFDGTEIDEILSLRIMTMTDEEKHEMRQSDERARQMLERTENMPAEQFMKLHGAMRSLRPIMKEGQ